MGKTQKKKAREKLAGREKGKRGGKKETEVSSRFIFVFALSQFSGTDYLGAWNRLSGKPIENIFGTTFQAIERLEHYTFLGNCPLPLS